MSREKLYSIRLKEDREELSQYLRRGKASARSLTLARILLLAGKLVEMEVVDSISHMSVQKLLEKMKFLG